MEKLVSSASMILSILLGSILFLSACSHENNSDTPTPSLDGAKLSEVEKSFCSVDEKLVELNLDPVPLQLEFLNTPGTLLAFVKGSGACAAIKDINENRGTAWFGLQIHDSCLPNRSFWKITEGYNANETRYYKLDSIDPAGLPTMDLWGARTLNVSYARDSIGLRVMKCMSASSNSTR